MSFPRATVFSLVLLLLPPVASGQSVERVSLGATGAQGSGNGEGAAMSPDARFILFDSASPNLVAGDTNGVRDVFLRDRVAGTTTRVSVGSQGAQGNAASFAAAVSADGRICVFRSAATSLTPTIHSGQFQQVFVRDLAQGTTVQLSSGAATAVVGATEAGVTPDGRFVYWSEDAPVAGATLLPTASLHDRTTGATRRLSPPAGFGVDRAPFQWGGQGALNPRLAAPASAGDPLVTVQWLAGANLPAMSVVLPGLANYYTVDSEGRVADANGVVTVLVTPALEAGLPAGTTLLTSLGYRHNMRGPRSLMLDDSGRWLVYEHSVVPAGSSGGPGSVSGIFLSDLATGHIRLVSRRENGADPGTNCESPSISADGGVVAFQCWSKYEGGIYVRDLASTTITRVSENPFARAPSLSSSGRYLAFLEGAADESVLILLDRLTDTRRIVSRHRAQTVGYHGAFRPVLSADGTFVMFTSAASNMVTGDTNGADDVFVANAGGWPCEFDVWPSAVSMPKEATIRGLQVSTMPTCRWEATPTASWLALLNTPAGTGSGTFFLSAPVNTGAARSTSVHVGSTSVPVTQAGTSSDPPQPPPPLPDDLDTDTLLDAWERQFGLSPNSATGADGASGDPDGDGVSNAAEQRAGTHPRGTVVRYLAEGASTDFFATRLAVLNPGSGPATLVVRFQTVSGVTHRLVQTIGGQSRATIDPATTLGSGQHEYSTVIESDQFVVVDRTMTWSRADRYGSHAETALSSRASTWYLAEGATHSGFDLFYLLQNAHPIAIEAEVTFLRPAPAPPLVKTYLVPASSRFNVWVNGESRTDPSLAGLAATDVSAIVRTASDRPIIVERAMYLSRPSQPFAAGHESAGISQPSTSWFMAEGATGLYFDLFLLIANPTADDASITATYLLPDGTTLEKSYVVPAGSRFNIWVDEEQFPDGSGNRRLADVAVSTVVTSTNNVPIIVERAMWWPGPTPATWHEAHNSAATTATGTRWALAEGESGGPLGTETYVLIANTSATTGQVRVTFMFEDGGQAVRELQMEPRSRTNVAVATDVPEAAGRRFGVVVESLGTQPAQLVVERAMYSSAGGMHWAAGTNAPGSRIP